MRVTDSPAAANRTGNRPQARPSLRLLTSPAWLAADSAGSRRLVCAKTCRSVRSPCRWSWRPSAARGVAAGLEAGVAAGLADRERGQAEAEGGVGDAEEERLGAQPVRGGEVAGGERGGGDGAVAGGLVEPHRQAAAAGPTRSIFMITVVDQVRPWLMPSSTFAATTQPQVGAQISSSGTGRATSQPATRTGLRP